MRLNNFELIVPLLNFESEDDFYFIKILKRRKENPEMKTGVVVIKEYYISSLDYLDKKWVSMVNMAENHNARVTIRLNKRSYKKTAMKTLVDVAQKIEAGQYQAVKKSFSASAGKFNSDKDKKWIIDIDKEDFKIIAETIEDLEETIYEASPYGKKIKARIPSKTGLHLIVSPFDLRRFKLFFPTIDIKKDNPTNLFIP